MNLIGNVWTVIGKSAPFTIVVGNYLCMAREVKLSQVLQRELKGKILSRVAKEVGISTSLLHDWHSSARKPSAKNLWQLKKLADHIGLTLEEILFDESSERHLISSTIFSDKGSQYRVCIEKVRGDK